MRNIVKGIRLFEKIFIYISAFFMSLLSLIIFYEVVARYVFNSPTIWVNEIATYMLQFIVFFSMGYLLLLDDHLKVTFVLDSAKGVAKKILEIITPVLVIPYAGVLVYYGYQYMDNSLQLGMVSPTLLEFPLWIPYSFIASGGALLVLASVASIIKILLPDQVKALEEEGKN